MQEGWKVRTLRAVAILLGLSLGSVVVRPSAVTQQPGSVAPLAARALAPTGRPVHQSRVVALSVAPSAFEQLEADIAAMAGASGARLGVALRELGGRTRRNFSYAGDQSFKAASLYKLPALMAQAQAIAQGASRPSERICFKGEDYESGWYDDYDPGSCYSVTQLGYRMGKFSDNTAAHMLVRHIGGVDRLNAFAASAGAQRSRFFDPNMTTADDMAALWTAEVTGNLGGTAAQDWLYPMLSRSQFESGIPAGSPGAIVLHKIGSVEGTEGDAALVSVPGRKYVLVVIVSGVSELRGWPLIARIANRVFSYESAAGLAELAATPVTVPSPAKPPRFTRAR
jgi:beta-lactamase class A